LNPFLLKSIENLTLHTSKIISVPCVCYEIFIRSFCDSNQDGIGDLAGLTSKLDYLQQLGIEAIWLSPFCKSGSYHKYDVIDYQAVDVEFGTLEDLKVLIREAHLRNIKVIFDFVINHTSSKHPWFLEAQKGENNAFRDFYIWQTPDEIKNKGLESRRKTADSSEVNPWHWAKKGDTQKYYGMFWSGMPDLNMDNPAVRKEVYAIGRYWLEQGIDGFRMDAAKHIYPEWEAEKCHAFWVEFREKMEAFKPDVYIVGEVWTSAEKIAPFFKGLKANFNFDLSYAIQEIVRTGHDKPGLISMLMNNYKVFERVNPHFVDATLLTNHDQDRIGSIASGSLEKLKMAAFLLLTLPGNPFLYYGEEIGMLGKKPDENIREAFLWNSRWQDKDRTNWRKPQYNTDSKVRPLAAQIADPASLYNHYKTLIGLRKSFSALGQVSPPNLSLSQSNHPKAVSFLRADENDTFLIIQNIQAQPIHFTITERVQELIFASGVFDFQGENRCTLPGFGSAIFKLKHEQGAVRYTFNQ
jgi:alpha-amylase